jgi:hypothetical protein
MNDWLQSEDLNRRLRGWWIIFGLGAAGGVLTLVRLASVPADPKNALLLGFSASRLAIMALVLVLTAGLAGAAWFSSRRPLCLHPKGRARLYRLGIPLSALLALACQAALFYLYYYPVGKYLAYHARLEPLLTWVGWMAALLLGWLVMVRLGLRFDDVRQRWRGVMAGAGIALGLCAAAALFVNLTGIGWDMDAVAWGKPGVPLLEWQLWLAAVLGVGVAVLLPDRRGGFWPDVGLALLIWISTALLWQAQATPLTYFTLGPYPPNQEFYPYSDAANHDLVAQHLLLGNGYMHAVIKRPLLSLFFGLLHVLAGQDYEAVISLQTIVLALLPVALYFLGRALHGRGLGLALALLAALREVNMIAATPYSRISHSKLLMSDEPAALGLVLFTLAAVVWLKAPHRRRLMPLVAGGVMGLQMMVRPQSVLLVPLVLAAAFFALRRTDNGGENLRSSLKTTGTAWLASAALMGVGIVLVITPWVARNYALTGRVVFDQTEQVGIFTQRYTDMPGYAMPDRLPGETEEDYNQRLVDETVAYTLRNPGSVARFVAAHFLNNTIHTALTIPIRDEVTSFGDAFTITSNWYDSWGDRPLRFGEAARLTLNLGLIALGIIFAWRRWGWAGLLPLLVNLSYSLSNAVVRNSGWRYIFPADWVGYLYYGLGLLEVMLAVLLVLGFDRVEKPAADTHQKAFAWRGAAALGVAFLLAGALVPAAEWVFPVQYPNADQAAALPGGQRDILADLQAQANLPVDPDELAAFAASEDVAVFRGRAFYPVWYDANQGEPGFGWVVYSEKPFARLGLVVINDGMRYVLLRIDAPPGEFPNNSEVLVAGCVVDHLGYIDASVIALPESGALYTREGWPVLDCPPAAESDPALEDK